MRKRLTAMFAAVCLMTPTALADEIKFADVSSGAWYNEAVSYVSEKQIMTGTDDGCFSPDGDVTRGMLVTMLYRIDGSPEVKNVVKFPDVQSGTYYENAVAWANKYKLVNGYANGNFGPDDALTREQMALMLFRFAAYRGFGWSNRGDLSIYTDKGDISRGMEYALGWADGYGIIKGSDGKINPQEKATRAETAAVFMRFLNQFIPDYGKTEQEIQDENQYNWYEIDVTDMTDDEIGKEIKRLIEEGTYDIKVTSMIHYPAQYVVKDVLNEWCAEDIENRAGKIRLSYDKATYITSYGFQNCYALGEFYAPAVEKLEQCAFLECKYMRKLYVPLVTLDEDKLWGCDRLTDITAIGW